SPNAFSAKRCTSRRVQHLKRFQARNVQLRLPTRPYQFLVCRALDKNAAYPKAEASLKAAGILPQSVELRQVKYLNNLIEQDHRFMLFDLNHGSSASLVNPLACCKTH